MTTIKSTFHVYDFDTRKPADKAAYAALRKQLTGAGLECFETWGSGPGHWAPFRDQDGATVELETKHLFNNQWNTAPGFAGSDKGRRVFDWAQDYPIGGMSAHIKRGHWIEQTAEMKELRRNTHACGYCGHQEAAQRGLVFCDRCTDSEYLTEEHLHLTRMRAIDDTSDRAPLTEAEAAHLLPIFRAAQLHGSTERGKARIAKQRADIQKDYDSATKHAAAKRAGLLWFMDRGINIDNLIYYSHTGRFAFGWRQPCSPSFVQGVLAVISEFPYPYDIKCSDGRTLSGD